MKSYEKLTVRRDGDVIHIVTLSGAKIATIFDHHADAVRTGEMIYDNLADTRMMLDHVTAKAACDAAGLDLATIQMIDSMPDLEYGNS